MPSPRPYAPLLDAWTRAGYVVAAPIFPLENADAPGGPSERDLVNQPGDMSLVMSRLTPVPGPGSGALPDRIDMRRVAFAGQSDGGDTALAAAYDPSVRDPRVRAAIILSGAEDPFAPGVCHAPQRPPAARRSGHRGHDHPPESTYSFYRQATPPKFLLRLLGAGHQPPYTERGPELTAVQRVTIAFLERFFRGRDRPLARLLSAGTAGGDSVLTGHPA